MEVEDGNLIDEPLKNDLFIKNSLDNDVKEQNGNFIAGESPVPNLQNGSSSSARLELETHSMEVDDIIEEGDMSCIEVSEATMQEATELEHMELDDDMMEAAENVATKLEATVNCALSEDIFLCSDDSLEKLDDTTATTTTTLSVATNGIQHTSLQVEEIAPENYAQLKESEEEHTQSIVELADGDQIAVEEEKSYSESFKIMDISSKCENLVAEEINVGENLDKLEAALNEISADQAIVVEADDEEQRNFLDKPSDVPSIETTTISAEVEEKTADLVEDIEQIESAEKDATTETSVINISDDMEIEKSTEQNNQSEAVDKEVEVPVEEEAEPESAEKELVLDDDISIVEKTDKDVIFEIIDDDSNDKTEVPQPAAAAVVEKECCEQKEVATDEQKDKLAASIIEIDDDDSMPKNQNEQQIESVNIIETPAVEAAALPMEICAAEEMEKAETAEIFENKECINHECARKSTEYYRAALFVLNAFNVNKRKKQQFVCGDCWEIAVQNYEEYAALLSAGKCLYDFQQKASVSDCVEVIDSSDEEDNDGGYEQSIERKNKRKKFI